MPQRDPLVPRPEKRLDRIEQRLGTPATQPTVAQPSVATAKGE